MRTKQQLAKIANEILSGLNLQPGDTFTTVISAVDNKATELKLSNEEKNQVIALCFDPKQWSVNNGAKR